MELRNKLCFDDILLRPEYSCLDSRRSVSLQTNIGKLILTTPIISSPMDSITGRRMLVAMSYVGGIGILTRYINMQDTEELCRQCDDLKWATNNGAQRVGCAIGIKSNTLDKANRLLDVGCDIICLDAAHGDHEKMYEAIRQVSSLRNSYKFTLMAGNICTPKAARAFADVGVDAIKVGIGPGAACTTRQTTGFGYPQLSAIQDAAQAVRNYPDTCVIADGGIRTSGDMVKSLWAGASACMIGYLLSGTNKTPTINGHHVYRGMSSSIASGRTDVAEEGVEVPVIGDGDTEEVLQSYIKSLKSGFAMGGAENIDVLRDRVVAVLVSSLSMAETRSKN